MTGWHLKNDIRPAHFLGVHAQQPIPLIGLLASKTLGGYARLGLGAVSVAYMMVWIVLTWLGLSD